MSLWFFLCARETNNNFFTKTKLDFYDQSKLEHRSEGLEIPRNRHYHHRRHAGSPKL